MEVILDSSFIISCIRERIDFLSQLEEQGFTVKVPREVMQEMKDLRKRNGVSHEDRQAIDVAFEIIEYTLAFGGNPLFVEEFIDITWDILFGLIGFLIIYLLKDFKK